MLLKVLGLTAGGAVTAAGLYNLHKLFSPNPENPEQVTVAE